MRLRTYSNNLKEQKILLLNRFKAPRSTSIANIAKEKYILIDTIRYRELREYIAIIIRSIKII